MIKTVWRLLGLGLWPIWAGLTFDIIDEVVGDFASGWEGLFAGLWLTPFASFAPTLLCEFATKFLDQTRSSAFVIIGVLLSLLYTGSFFIWLSIDPPGDPMAGGVLVLALMLTLPATIATSLAFWLIRRPDRDVANPAKPSP